ncbi:MAG: GDSL-type esterase/lipase family protein [Acidimicrobiia bacterium]
MRARVNRGRWSRIVVSALLVGLTVVPTLPAIGQETIRILPLGDSITEGKKGDATYRYFLWHHLLNAGHDVDFVGSMNGVKGTGVPKYPDFDQDHEGHSGWTANQMAKYAKTFAQQASAQIVLVHLGTNDVLKGQTNASTRSDLETVISQLRLANPQMVILLAEIIPIAGKEAQVQELNALIRSLATETNTTSSSVIAVDHYTDFNANTDLYDGIHPSESGYDKIADRWFDVLGGLLGEVSSPTTVTLTEPTAGASFPSGSSILLKASVGGEQLVTKVVFLADGVPVGEDTTSPYEFSWSGASDGQLALNADAHEQGSAIVSSPAVSITVGNPPVSSEVLVVVGDPANIGSGEARVIERLAFLGFTVAVADDKGITAGAASGKVLVMISASVDSGKIGTTFTGTALPVIALAGELFDDLGMTGAASGVDYGETAGTDKRKTLVITASTHPLASGLSGTVTVSDPASKFMWGLPASSAALVATLENDPAKYAVFGYESGTAMVSGFAPARRVGLFLHEKTASTLTAAGWSIFDSAVQWATGG